MKPNRSWLLAHEVECVLYASSSTWEGIEGREIPLGIGEVVLRHQPGFAAAMPLRFEAGAVEEQLDQAIQQVEHLVPWCLWVIGPSSQPTDLEQRLLARVCIGFVQMPTATGSGHLVTVSIEAGTCLFCINACVRFCGK